MRIGRDEGAGGSTSLGGHLQGTTTTKCNSQRASEHTAPIAAPFCRSNSLQSVTIFITNVLTLGAILSIAAVYSSALAQSLNASPKAFERRSMKYLR